MPKTLPSREGVLAIMDGVRAVCRDRSTERADDAARRFDEVLKQYRATQAAEHRSSALVSIALDHFVSEARSAAELCAGRSEPSEADVARVERSLSSLNHMFVASEQAVAVQTMTPASFMPGAESVMLLALRDVRLAAEEARERHEGQENRQLSAVHGNQGDSERREQERHDQLRREEDQRRDQFRRDEERRRQEEQRQEEQRRREQRSESTRPQVH